MYVVIFIKIYFKNKKSVGLTERAMKTRRQKNVITFTGEMGTFVLSSMVITWLVLLQRIFKVDWIVFHPLTTSIHTIYANALISVCHFVSSPEMMRYVFKLYKNID